MNQYILSGDVLLRQKVEFIVAILFLIGLIVVSRNVGKYVSGTAVEGKRKVIVLDAGHGGGDPGKVGINGAKEKDINLAVAQKIKVLLEKQQIQVIMTREDDRMLSGENATNKKVEDMKARVKLVNEKMPDLAVSIHQNSYQEESISGAQVFYYSHSTEGKAAAERMQKALLSCNPTNSRQAKANDTYYLLKRTEVATIIVEAGFLSNQEEADKLVTEAYQEQVAQAVCDGVMEYLGL